MLNIFSTLALFALGTVTGGSYAAGGSVDQLCYYVAINDGESSDADVFEIMSFVYDNSTPELREISPFTISGRVYFYEDCSENSIQTRISQALEVHEITQSCYTNSRHEALSLLRTPDLTCANINSQ